jgi:hypothetical protein
MLDSFRLRMATLGGYEGDARRRNSQKIIDASWMRDPATKPVYVKWVDSGLPVIDDNDVPVYAKYNVKSYHNITGDEIAYLLQFRLEDMSENPNIKVGSYVQIPNEMGEPEWWIITHLDDRTQFRQYSILKCLHIYRWVSKVDGKRKVYECLGAPRNQSSYNSGVWLDYTFQVPENQHIAMLPTNADTRTIGYDCRFLLSDPERRPALAWQVSKIMSSFNGAITKFTMTQEQFNPTTDNADLMIADYWENAIEPELPNSQTTTPSNIEITYSGSPTVRAGGGYKKFTLKQRIDGELVDVVDEVTWSDNFGDMTGNILYSPDTLDGNIFKVKCINDYSLIGKTFNITATSGNSSTSIIVEVTSL